MDCKEQLVAYAGQVERALMDYFPAKTISNQVEKAMAYSLCGGGKRIRGALVLAVVRLFREDYLQALPYAAALEMIHAYSLIHDDLPCMDDDDLRRGQPACHIAFGEAVALLAGDGLLTLAFETMVRPECLERFSPAQAAGAVAALARAAGTQGMIGGQLMDLDNEGKQVGGDELRRTDSKKTGALFRACGEIGCILGNAEPMQRQGLLDYMDRIGLAFQIVDDMLDQVGDQATLGKPLHSDEAQRKSTYATLYGIEECRRMTEQLNGEAKGALGDAGLQARFLCELSDWLTSRTA